MSNWNIFFILFIGLFLAIGITFLVLYFKGRRTGKKTAEQLPVSPADPGDYYRFGDAFEIADFLGKTPSQTGVNEKYFTVKGGWQVLPFDTVLFGKTAYGWVYFAGEAVGDEQVADTVFVNSKELSFEQCREALIAEYGAPASEWETPYVEVNGGAQSGCRFQSGNLCIELTQGSEREYIELQMRNEEVEIMRG
ncbi:MAG: hypothetical protein IJI67_01210 [Clostridia bacterium]|nr:hypothetical protein [Clostridia bacterium]